jgi:hypothetical protein
MRLSLRQRPAGLGAVLVLLLTLLTCSPTAAAEAVDLQLVLAVDVSRSVDEDEFRLQREGYANAFRDPRVLGTILAGNVGAIAVTYMEWSNAHLQNQVVPWTRIVDEETAATFADAILERPRSFAGWTSISGAIDFSVALLANSGFSSERRVIDISGDGSNNSGRPVQNARDDAVARGITINGLAILNVRPNPWLPPEPNLDEYFLKNVIGGTGAFMMVAENFQSFHNAILQKLIREIAGEGPKEILAKK